MEEVSPTTDTVIEQPSDPPTLPVVRRKPRVWTALLLPVLAIVFMVIVQGIVLAALAFDPARGTENLAQRTTEAMETIPGFLSVILSTQLSILATTLLAAWCSPVPIRERLRLTPPNMKVSTWFLFCAASLFCAFSGTILVEWLFGGESSTIEAIETMVQRSSGPMAIVMFLAISLAPGFCEEILFRGYVQTRLLERWPPTIAILTSGVYFAAIHLDPGHIIAVIPLGIWLSVLAWHTRSAWPAIACHATNNGAFVVWTWLSPEEGPLFDLPTLLLLVMTAVAFAIAVKRIVHEQKSTAIGEITLAERIASQSVTSELLYKDGAGSQ